VTSRSPVTTIALRLVAALGLCVAAAEAQTVTIQGVVVVTGQGAVPFDPAVNRVFVRFIDGGGMVRGATGVGVRTE
jgi:hypothetical protein